MRNTIIAILLLSSSAWGNGDGNGNENGNGNGMQYSNNMTDVTVGVDQSVYTSLSAGDQSVYTNLSAGDQNVYTSLSAGDQNVGVETGDVNLSTGDVNTNLSTGDVNTNLSTGDVSLNDGDVSLSSGDQNVTFQGSKINYVPDSYAYANACQDAMGTGNATFSLSTAGDSGPCAYYRLADALRAEADRANSMGYYNLASMLEMEVLEALLDAKDMIAAEAWTSRLKETTMKTLPTVGVIGALAALVNPVAAGAYGVFVGGKMIIDHRRHKKSEQDQDLRDALIIDLAPKSTTQPSALMFVATDEQYEELVNQVEQQQVYIEKLEKESTVSVQELLRRIEKQEQAAEAKRKFDKETKVLVEQVQRKY